MQSLYNIMDSKVRKHEHMNGSSDDDGKRSICRDFLRNVCHRGRRCKFKHPSSEELKETVDVSGSDISYEFCHDFQNNQCQRSNCRFIHCTPEEEENYNASKKLPLRLKYQYDFGIGDRFLGQEKVRIENNLQPLESTGRPICRDFLNRDCHRGKKCKFLHFDQHQMAVLAAEAEAALSVEPEAGIKRARILVEELDSYNSNRDYSQMHSNSERGGLIAVPKRLEEENRMLKKRVQELEKQVSDLAATNEVLLEQNAQFRLHKRGIPKYGCSSEGMATSFAPALNPPVNVVASNAPRPVPVQLSVQVTGQPQVGDRGEYLNGPGQELLSGGPGQVPQCAVVAPGQRLQVPASVPHTTDIAAQVIAANLAANSTGSVELLQGTNQVVSGLSAPMSRPPNPQLAQPNLNQMTQQPIASFSAPVQNRNQLVQQPMASFSAPVPSHNPMGGQQAASFAGTIMAAALAGGRCALQTGTNTIAVSLAGEVHQPVGSMGPAVPLPQPALVYTVTRSTENMPLVSTMVPGTGHEMTLVADTSRNPVSSMPASLHVGHAGQGFNNVSPASQGIVQASSHQTNEIVPVAQQHPCAPMTSGIAASNVSMPPAVSMGGVRPVVQSNLVQSPRINNAGQRTVVQGASQISEQALLSYPISAVPQAQMRN